MSGRVRKGEETGELILYIDEGKIWGWAVPRLPGKKKKVLISFEISTFLVETTELESVTSCV